VIVSTSEVTMKYLTLMLCSFMLCSLALLASAGALRAEDLSLDQMVCALNPDQCSAPFGDRRVRGISATASVSGAVRPPGSFDITLNFPYNSAALTADSRAKLDQVAKALTEPTTNNLEIIVSGHTDASGSAQYNLLLSERRAQAVRGFLVTERGIEPNRLVAKGYGKTQPLFPSDPYNDLNRRVQFQNANYATASVPTAAPATAAAPAGPPAAKPSFQPAKGKPPRATPAAAPGQGDGL
jgi:outer membrane protein OmpA-like peptidoglycan-associated protein